MLGQRPFKDTDEVFAAADRIWQDLGPEDWHEAFRAHPRIGQRTADSVAAQEQAEATSAGAVVLNDLADANLAYEARFGHIYIVCAAGKSAEEMLALCRGRLVNDPDTELRVAAEEQRKITRLRLEKLLEKA